MEIFFQSKDSVGEPVFLYLLENFKTKAIFYYLISTLLGFGKYSLIYSCQLKLSLASTETSVSVIMATTNQSNLKVICFVSVEVS